MVNSEAVLKRWKEHFEKLMNEENNRDPRTEAAEVVNKEVNCISSEEVKNTLRRMKKSKVIGPDELPVEVWMCMGEMGIKFLTRLFNRLLVSEQMPEEKECAYSYSGFYKKMNILLVGTREQTLHYELSCNVIVFTAF